MASKPVLGGAAVASLIATAVLATLPFTASQEGYVARPRADPVGYKTGCFGDRSATDDRIYSRDECETLLRRRLAADYAPPILSCVPQFADRKRLPAFSMAIDASYNAGPVAVCRSPMAVHFRAGQWAAGCAAFVGWRDTAKGARLPGLVKRRQREAANCRAAI